MYVCMFSKNVCKSQKSQRKNSHIPIICKFLPQRFLFLAGAISSVLKTWLVLIVLFIALVCLIEIHKWFKLDRVHKTKSVARQFI